MRTLVELLRGTKTTHAPTTCREAWQCEEVVPGLEEADEQPLTFLEQDELVALPRTDQRRYEASQHCEALGANPHETRERLRAALEQGYSVCLSCSATACSSSDGGQREAPQRGVRCTTQCVTKQPPCSGTRAPRSTESLPLAGTRLILCLVFSLVLLFWSCPVSGPVLVVWCLVLSGKSRFYLCGGA